MAELVVVGILRPRYFQGQAMLDVQASDLNDSARRIIYANDGTRISIGVEVMALVDDNLLADW